MGKIFDLKKKNTKGVKVTIDDMYNYSDTKAREKTIGFLYDNSLQKRQTYDEYCKLMRRYYDGTHDTTTEMASFINDSGLPWSPTQCTDGYIHVETQIDTNIPEFEFSGRDDDLDSTKAKTREYVVRYVLENNKMDVMNTRNERRINIYGAAVWKVAFDATKKMGQFEGDIVIGNPKIQQILWDPNIEDDIDDGEYFAIVYPMHKMQVSRTFKKDLKKAGKTIKDFSVGYGYTDTEFMKQEVDSSTYSSNDDCLQVTEWYFKQPADGQEIIDGVEFTWKAGDIGLVILINGEEIRYNPKYWRKTNCRMFPASVYCKVPNDETITGKSEIEPIKGYIDAADRALGYAQLNDAFFASDAVLVEKGAIADGGELNNVPGGVTVVNPNKLGGIARIPNSSSANYPLYDAADRFKTMMQNTNGNFDAFQGNSPTKATTATEIAILNDRAKSRQDLKKADRQAGWERLIRLIDYTALEVFDDDRNFFIGAPKEEGDPSSLTFNSNNMRILDDIETQRTGNPSYYYPIIDTKIYMGDGLKNSKAFTISAVKELANMVITPENYKFIEAYIEEIGIPQKVELTEFIEEIIKMQKEAVQQPPQAEQPQISMQEVLSKLNSEELQAVESNPEIMQQAVEEQGVALAE